MSTATNTITDLVKAAQVVLKQVENGDLFVLPPDTRLAPDHPQSGLLAAVYARHRLAEKAMAAVADNIHKVIEAFDGDVYIEAETDRVAIRVTPATKIPRAATAEKLRALLPEWQIKEARSDDATFVYVSRSVLGQNIVFVVWSTLASPPATEPEADPMPPTEPSIEPQEEAQHAALLPPDRLP